MRFWINNLHLEAAPSFAEEVPGSNGLLYYFDIRYFGWTKESFSAIARREPYCIEPEIDSATAILLRKIIDVTQDPKTLHVEAMVRADWFFRDTFESDRSDSYFDALFARFRFKSEVKTAPAGATWHPAGVNADGSSYPAGYYLNDKCVLKSDAPINSKAESSKAESKFPKDEKDFERLFGVDKFRDFLKEFKIDTRHGAVVEGAEKEVSIVARQNRLVERIQTPTGEYYKTFDVKETTGKRDFAETLNKDFEFDAGEILAGTPCGGMACLLVDNKGTIVATADNRFAQDSSDFKYDTRVRTPGSCFICHEKKYIKPQNLVEDMLKSGVDILFRKKEAAIGARAFFLEWTDKLDAEQNRFTRFIQRTSGFLPGENALQLKIWRDEYDNKVDLAKAARELGVSEAEFKLIGLKSTKARVLMLIRGLTIPRKTFEVDVYKEMVLQKNAENNIPINPAHIRP